MNFAVVERLNSCCSKEEIKAITFEELKEKNPKIVDTAWLGEKQPMRTNNHFKSLDLSNREVKPFVPSIESSSHLKHDYLGDNKTLPPIIPSSLNANQEKGLMNVLRRYKKAIGWTMADIKGISPSICMHKILLEDCYSNFVKQ